jgi:gamma-glutamyl-gamma-aminobutyrate hydrolase PuuD
VNRPLVAIPARFAAHASALRYRAEVAARALVEAVYRAGGEPWVMHPDAAEAERRLARADALLLPGGGDLAVARGGGKADASCYHHQCVDRIGDGLRPVAWAADGTVEALELDEPRGWFVAVQWHPEDTPDQWLFDALVRSSFGDRRGGV